MIKIIGKIGCTKCVELRDKLEKEGAEFEYLVFEKLTTEERKNYAKLIRSENNGYFPLVINEDGKVEHIE